MDAKALATLLDRGVSEVNVRKNLEEKLKAGKKLRVKFGIDPTGFDLTLGHAIPLRKLRQFQDLGHQVVLLFGTFTAQIGDPTGKSATRVPLTKDQILKNAETYLEQAGKVLDIEKCEVVYNGDWLEGLNFGEILKIAGNFTVAQMLERDMFQERIKAKQEINLIEFLYPLMQGYDSVPIKADVEIGGTDQLFNMMAARPIQKHFEMAPQNVITVPILVGLDGKEKMSKSLNNYIAILDTPSEKFGKVMSIPDKTMLQYFELLTEVDLKEAKQKIEADPRGAKVFLAKEILRFFHDDEAIEKAEQDFIQKFIKKEVPDEMPDFSVGMDEIGILTLIAEVCSFAGSNSQARQLIAGNAVSIDGKAITDPQTIVRISGEMILKVGKRKFGRISK